jgi:hypothetical protein
MWLQQAYFLAVIFIHMILDKGRNSKIITYEVLWEFHAVQFVFYFYVKEFVASAHSKKYFFFARGCDCEGKYLFNKKKS